MRPKVERLAAVDEEGNACALVRTTPYRRLQSLSGVEWMPGVPTMRTEDGEHCNPDGPGRYVTLRTGRRFTLAD